MEYIIGKDGNQPFKIQNAGVSRRHAKISIEGDVWILEDLDSTNGTFIQEEDGCWKRIGRIRVTPFSVIRLGDSSVNGFTFWALWLTKTDQNDFSEEFDRLLVFREQLITERKKKEKRNKLKRCLPAVIYLIVFSLTLNMSPTWARICFFIPSFANIFISYNSGLAKIQEKRQKLLVCPRCGRPLSDYELERYQCAVCKAHS